MDFLSLPKIELHLHLDCSLSYDVVRKLNSDISKEQYRRQFIAPDKCRDLADYIRRSKNAIELMQTAQALYLVVEDLFEQLAGDNVIYAEIRFAPLLHVERELSAQEVVSKVNKAVEKQVQKTGIEANIILCTLRHYSTKQSMETVKLVEEFNGSRVAGFDIAADEAGYPIDNHIAAFEYADQKGIYRTAHAGEARGADSVWETLENFAPSRLGHGVRSAEDPELLSYLKEHNIHLEVCPTSNVQTTVYESISDHRVDELFEEGISLSINTDTRTISNVTLEDEYRTLSEVFGWRKDHFLRSNLEAVDHAFTSDEVKNTLRDEIKAAY